MIKQWLDMMCLMHHHTVIIDQQVGTEVTLSTGRQWGWWRHLWLRCVGRREEGGGDT